MIQRSRAVSKRGSPDDSATKGESAPAADATVAACVNVANCTCSAPFRVGAVGTAGRGSECLERWQLHVGPQSHDLLGSGTAVWLLLAQQLNVAGFSCCNLARQHCSVGLSVEQGQDEVGTNGNTSIAAASQTQMRPAITLDAVRNMVDLNCEPTGYYTELPSAIVQKDSQENIQAVLVPKRPFCLPKVCLDLGFESSPMC